ncbi:ATP-binding protein [Streptomyces sp. NPDC090106]|uniref:ATP-binding protein n=1 Tax=Streptomyces sp. NPDC090106 TaxID=3365946 RepID=UPI0037FA7BF4
MSADGDARAAVVGRDREIAALGELSAGHRLVTVTGPAGVGKSTVAAAAVASSAGWECLVQVRWHGSGPGRPGDLAAELVTRLTGTLPAGAVDPAWAARHLPDVPTLLFLDDVDPVYDECVRLVQRVLVLAPRTRVVVTSRRALGLDAERILRLEGLSTRPSADGGRHAPAVELFLRQAPSGLDRERDLTSVSEVCGLLEGLPLAVVLAAEQSVRLPVQELPRLVHQGQGWLSGTRPALRRHRSLRDAVGSGWMLCDRAVRTVWARAGVFAGSFTEASAVYMCQGGDIGPAEVPACLAQLTALGVLEVDGEVGGVREPRYRMTGLAREFGAERLTAEGELPAAALRRSQRWGQVAAEAERLWDIGSQARAVRLVSEEHDELAAMLRHAHTDPSLAPAALQAGVRLWFWWVACGRADEGAALLRGLLPHCEDDPVLARGQWLAAWLSVRSRPRLARALLDEAWWSSMLDGDTATVGRIAHAHGTLALQERDVRAAAEHFGLASDLIPAHSPGGPPPALSQAALALVQAGPSPATARRTARRALAQAELRHDLWARQVALYASAFADHRLGRSARAWHRARRALADPELELPSARHGATALRHLITTIETGVGGTETHDRALDTGGPLHPDLPTMLVPRTAIPVPSPRSRGEGS